MKDIHMLGDWKQVKVVADPLRMRILEAFRDNAMTTKQVATVLGEKPINLYHHVKMLERVGLIRLVETRSNRGTVEKYYRAVAGEFIVDRKFLERAKGAKKATRGYESLFLGALEATLAEARRSIAAKLITPVESGRNALMHRQQFSGTEEEIRQLMKKIQEWIEECQAACQGEGQKQYGLTIAFYPLKRRAKPRSIKKAAKGRKQN